MKLEAKELEAIVPNYGNVYYRAKLMEEVVHLFWSSQHLRKKAICFLKALEVDPIFIVEYR